MSERPSPEACDQARLLTLFGRRGWLAGHPEGFRRQIVAMGRLLLIKRNCWVFAIGDPPGGIYGIVSGGIGVEGGGPFHALRLGHVLRSGGWFGHHPALSGGGQRTQGMRAMEDSLLLHVPLGPLQALMQQDPAAARCIGDMADRGSILATRVISDLLIPDASQRIAAVLLRITGAEDGIEPDDPAGVLLTQTEIGEIANVSRPHVNRILAGFVSQGWISKRYHHLRVLDGAALRRHAATSA
jgi:CRP-like cAMP-binding protein